VNPRALRPAGELGSAERVARYVVPVAEVADIVLDEHAHRQGNPGAADWRIRRGTSWCSTTGRTATMRRRRAS
jgi:hypothetical protein